MINVIKKILKKPYIFTLFGITVFSLFTFAGCETAKEGMMPYNAVLVETGLTFRADFLKENIIQAYYYYYDNEGKLVGEWKTDETLPHIIVHIIKDQGKFEEVFADFPQIDFEKEMIFLYVFATPHSNRIYKIKSIKLESKTLRVGISEQGGKQGYGDAGVPQRRILVIKMDRLDLDTVEFSWG